MIDGHGRTCIALHLQVYRLVAIVVLCERRGVRQDHLSCGHRRRRPAAALPSETAVDAMCRRPPASNHPLFSLPNVILTQHTAGPTLLSRRIHALAFWSLSCSVNDAFAPFSYVLKLFERGAGLLESPRGG